MSEPPDTLDVSLDDLELLEEVGLLAEVMAAANPDGIVLTQGEVDRLLGVDPTAG